MEERLQKILARGGLASRRAAEQMLSEGRVRVNGRVVTELGSKADPRNDKIEVDGKRVVAEDFVYAVLHKPRGVVSTLSDPEGRPTVAEYVSPLGARCYPVGRLDFATSGVLLITNDGAFADGLLHPKRAVPKTYIVKTNGTMKPTDFERWETGVRLEDGTTTGKAVTNFLRHEGDKTWFELTISEGKNQQIRRMGVATGFQVMRLSRVSFAGVSGEGLRPGTIRMLTLDELRSIKDAYGVPKRVRAPRELAAPTHAPEARPRGPRAPRGVEAQAPSTEVRPRGSRATKPTDEQPARLQTRDRREGSRPVREPEARDDRPTRKSPFVSRDERPARPGARGGRSGPPARDGAPARGSRDGAPARGSRDGAPARGSRDGAPARGSRDGAPARTGGKPAPRGKSGSRDEKPTRGQSAGRGGPSAGGSRTRRGR